MPTYLAAPTIERTGVVSGFVLDQGSGLVPSISLGVLFAQGTMYRPAPPPDQYNVTAASWANTQFSVTNAVWVAGMQVTLPHALAEALGLPDTCMLAAAIFTIGAHSIIVGQTVATGGIVTTDGNQGYNTTAIVIAVTSTTVAIAMPQCPGNGRYHPPSLYTPLGAPNVPTLAAGVATVTIGAHSIPAAAMAEVSEINPSGYDLGEVFMLSVGSTTISYSIAYPPTNASGFAGPGTYVSGGIVETPWRGPTLPAAPASAQSWLFYNSSGGFYWNSSNAPTTAGDAFLGWVETNASEVIAWSVRRLGSGPEPFVVPYPAPLAAISAGEADTLLDVTNQGSSGAPYMLPAEPLLVYVTATTQDCYLAMPATAAMPGQDITVELAPGSTFAVYLVPNGSDTIDKAAGNFKISGGGNNYTFSANSGDWPIVAFWRTPSALVLIFDGRSAQLSASYAGALQASGGTPGYTYSITSGSLPPGLTLNSDGTVTGTPTAIGGYPFTGQVVDGVGTLRTVSAVIVVSPVLPSNPPSSSNVVLTDAGPHVLGTPNQPFTTIQVAVSLLDGTETRLNLWMSQDGGAHWGFIGAFPASGSAATLTLGASVFPPNGVLIYGQTVQVAITTGNAAGDNPPSSWVVSNTITLSNPAALASDISSAGIGGFTNSGTTWGATVSWNSSGAASDPEFWYAVLTVQGVDASGNPDPTVIPNSGGLTYGTEREVGNSYLIGSYVFTNNVSGWGFPPPGYQYKFFRFRMRVKNTSQEVPGAVGTIQTTCWGGSDHLDFDPTNPGTAVGVFQPAIQLSSLAPPTDNALVNPDFLGGLQGWTQMHWNGTAFSTEVVWNATNSVYRASQGNQFSGASAGASATPITAPVSGNFLYLIQNLPARPGDAWMLSAWFQTSAGASAGFYGVSIVFLDSSGNIIAGSNRTSASTVPSTNWQQVSVLSSPAPSNTASIYLAIQLNGAAVGNFYVTNVFANRQSSGQVGTVPSVTGTPGVASQNIAVSQLWDFNFELSPPGQVQNGSNQWQSSGGSGASEVITGGGGYQGNQFCRLTGPSAEIFQTVAVAAGQPLYLALYCRSSNTAGGAHSLTVGVGWLNSAGALISSSTIGTVTGYQANWVQGPAGQVTAPANTASAVIVIENNSAEPSGGYWDVDYVLFQNVVQQTSNGASLANLYNTGGPQNANITLLNTADSGGTWMSPTSLWMRGPNGFGGITLVSPLNYTNGISVSCGMHGGATAVGDLIGLLSQDNTQPGSYTAQADSMIVIVRGGSTFFGQDMTFVDGSGHTRTVKGGAIVG